MDLHSRLGRRVALIAALGLIVAGAYSQAVQQRAHVDPQGAWIDALTGPAVDPGSGGSVLDNTTLWHINDVAAIAQSVAMSETNDTWIAWNLNSQRVTLLDTNGNGTPVYEGPLANNPRVVTVAAAKRTSLAIVSVAPSPVGTPAQIMAFSRAGGPNPLWTYTFDIPYDTVQQWGTVVAADGSFVLAIGYQNNTAISILVRLDGATGQETQRLVMSGLSALDLSADGTRAALTWTNHARIIETTGLTTLFEFSVSGAGGFARISADGKTVADGGFDFQVYHDTGSGWTRVWSVTQSGYWFGYGIALSADGSIVFNASNTYSNWLTTTYRVIDIANQVQLATTTVTGSGQVQDTAQRAQASSNGQLFSIISWGTQDVIHPQTQVFNRALHTVASLTSPGSPFGLDMTTTGEYLVVGAKHVHANAFGNGGDAYGLQVYKPGDLNCDGVVNFLDINPFVLALTDPAGYAAAFPNCTINAGDVNGDGAVDFLDINPFVALLGGP